MSPLSTMRYCFGVCVLGQGTLPSHASLESGVNEYLVGQRWQCVRFTISSVRRNGSRARILVQVTIYRRLLIGRDGHLDQSETYDISILV